MGSCRPSIRPLYAWEIQEAQRVFGNQIAYQHVRIHECVSWPDTIKQISLKLQGAQPNTEPNAITLGNHIYFPIRLPSLPNQVSDQGRLYFAWLVHELTHVWQYQKIGWRYLVLALNLQVKQGAHAYDYGAEKGLLDRLGQGWKFEDFNLEQQGDIARAYYLRTINHQDVRAWSHFIQPFQDQA